MKFWDKNDLRDPNVGAGKTVVLGLQHTFTMFGATILVPILVGFDISVALLMAGLGTLLFHIITRGGVPLFLGSSFSFIVPVGVAIAAFGGDISYALGGIVVSGLLYIVLAVLVYLLGAKRVIGWFPPIVTGSVIIIIGLVLAPVAINMAATGGAVVPVEITVVDTGEVIEDVIPGAITATNWLLALMSFLIVVIVAVFLKGFAKALPVLIGLFVSYIIAVILTLTGVTPGLVDFESVKDAAWFGIPTFTLAKFDIRAIMIVAPVAICTMVEHIGDIMAIGAITNKDYLKKPGLHRTLLGDGLASCLSAMFGGPANTTYSENTGVLALTKQFNPTIMRIAACFAIILGFIPKLAAVIGTIPVPIIGGISIVLFGMIASVGARLLVDNKVDFHKSRNLIIAAVIMVLGIGGALIPFQFGTVAVEIQGIALAAIVGLILNKLLPGADDYIVNTQTEENTEEKSEPAKEDA
ncbi:MAG: uracil-xanthine permease family protein [Oscillospiraceae bacterium]|nr:uracil-xanthine permease family protein [Oscillospiraceae bacterium]